MQRESAIQPGLTESDRDAVHAVARDYIEGWYAGDADRMERALHDDLVKRTPASSEGAAEQELRAVSKAQMVDLTRDGGGTDVAEPMIEVFVDDVVADIACARTVCADYVDYLHLVRTPEGWKVVNIVFHPLG